MINIAEILKYMPGTKLYSSLCGECKLYKVHEDGTIEVTDKFGNIFSFNEYGIFHIDGETYYLYPSEKEKSWENAIKEKFQTIPNMIRIDNILRRKKEGFKLYSPIFGWGALVKVDDNGFIQVDARNSNFYWFNQYGCCIEGGEPLLFPSKTDRNWETLIECNQFNPYDKVVVRFENNEWKCDFFSHKSVQYTEAPYVCTSGIYSECLPYNENTAKIIGTNKKYETDK